MKTLLLCRDCGAQPGDDHRANCSRLTSKYRAGNRVDPRFRDGAYVGPVDDSPLGKALVARTRLAELRWLQRERGHHPAPLELPRLAALIAAGGLSDAV